MTEKKQFQYNVNKNTIEYNGKFIAYVMNVDGYRIANEMNTLYEENEQLKQSLKISKDFIKEVEDFFKKHDIDTVNWNVLDEELDNNDFYYEEYKKMKKENEQLKSEINMLKTTIGRNEAYIKRLTHNGDWGHTAKTSLRPKPVKGKTKKNNMYLHILNILYEEIKKKGK